jgi:hypothetical protein
VTLAVTNLGNTDAYAVPLTLLMSRPDELRWEFPPNQFTPIPPYSGEHAEFAVDWNLFPHSSVVEGKGIYPFMIIGRVPAGQTVALEAHVRPSSNGSYELEAHVAPSWLVWTNQNPKFLTPHLSGEAPGVWDGFFKSDCWSSTVSQGINILSTAFQIPDIPRQDVYECAKAVGEWVTSAAVIPLDPPNSNTSAVTSGMQLLGGSLSTAATCASPALDDAFESNRLEFLGAVGDAISLAAGQYQQIVDCNKFFFAPRSFGRRGITAVSSNDPNDLLGPDGWGVDRYIACRSLVAYTVRFENVATATAPAHEIVVRVPLDSTGFDIGSLQVQRIILGERLIPVRLQDGYYRTDVDLRPESDLLARVLVQLEEGPALVVRCIAIDPLSGLPPEEAQRGVLPPNVVAPEGEGAVNYTLNLRDGLPSGTSIVAQGEITFDFNAPILTPPWSNRVDCVAPSSEIHAPVAMPQERPSVRHADPRPLRVSWSGGDAGSGVRDYTIMVSANGEPASVWLNQVSATSGVFMPEDSVSRYEFTCVARDSVGNVEGEDEDAVGGENGTAAAKRIMVTRTADEGAAVASTRLLGTTPNPVTGSANVSFSTAKQGWVTLRVYDVRGRRVATLLDQEIGEGRYTIAWKANSVGPGVYFMRMTTTESEHTARVLVVR